MEMKSNLEQEAEEYKQKLIKQAAEHKRKKEEEKKKLPPPKLYYDIKIECMLPATLTYRVLAETPEKAVEMIKGLSPTGVKHKLAGRREIKLMVYDAGSSMIRLVRNLIK